MKTTITLSIERRHVVALVLAILAAPLLLGAVHVLADALDSESTVPNVLTYDGFLEQNGEPVDGTFDFRFKIINDTGDTQWPAEGDTATRESVTVKQGHFFLSFPKDGEPALADDLLENGGLKLKVSLKEPGQADTEYMDFGGGLDFTSVPYALRAKVAERAKEATNTQNVGIIPSSEVATKEDVLFMSNSATALAMCRQMDSSRSLDVVSLMEGENGSDACTRWQESSSCLSVAYIYVSQAPLSGQHQEVNIEPEEQSCSAYVADHSAANQYKFWACCQR